MVYFWINSSRLLKFLISFSWGQAVQREWTSWEIWVHLLICMHDRAGERTTWLNSKREGSEYLFLINLYSLFVHYSCFPYSSTCHKSFCWYISFIDCAIKLKEDFLSILNVIKKTATKIHPIRLSLQNRSFFFWNAIFFKYKKSKSIQQDDASHLSCT